MKITASRRDDIIRERDQFDADAKARQALQDQEVGNWRKATKGVLSQVEELVKSKLPETSLSIEVEANTTFGDLIEVSISNQRFSPHVEGNALSWDWRVRLDKQGNVVKESNSWSGLKATTVEELDTLEESVKVLRACNSIEWADILSTALPQFDDYVQNRGPSPKRPDFESQLREAEIEELIGTDTLVGGKAGEGSGYRPGVDVYYLIHKESPKQYTVSCSYKLYVDQWIADGRSKEEILNEIGRFSFRINKAKFIQLVGKEVNTLTL